MVKIRLFKTLKEKDRKRRKESIERLAGDIIHLSDFEDGIYIAYDGTPLVPIDPSSTPAEILSELSKVRNNFINSRMKEYGLTKIAAAL